MGQVTFLASVPVNQCGDDAGEVTINNRKIINRNYEERDAI